MKVFVVVGTRPEIIRLSSLLSFMEDMPTIDLVVAYTNQNFTYSLSKIFFDDLNLKAPKYVLNNKVMKPMQFLGAALTWVTELLEVEQPDCFLCLGDTNSCLTALAAKKMQIPIFHLEAGNRCFDETVPEETNRKVVDHLADVNMTYSGISREYLLREGKRPDLVFNVGSPLYEVYERNKKNIASSNAMNMLGLGKGTYVLLSFHRHEALVSNDKRNAVIDAINFLADAGEKIIYPIHPKSRSIIPKDAFHPAVSTIEPLGYNDYMHLQINSKCVISDSGTINEEASICNFPAINIRATHERPEANECSQTIMTGYDSQGIVKAFYSIPHLCTNNQVNSYTNEDFSRNVTSLIMSYTPFVIEYIYAK